MNGVNLHSRMFCNMIKNFVNIINKGGVPNLSTAFLSFFLFHKKNKKRWEYIVESECIAGYNEAVEVYSS